MTADDRDRAQVLFAEANKLVEAAVLNTAAARYQKALEYWDHPQIRYNLGVILIEMDNPVAAYRNLTEALRFGEAPLGAENYKHARGELRSLRTRLVAVAVRCERAGVVVTLNGQKVLDCPDGAETLVEPGPHQWMARGGEFATTITTHAMWGNRRYEISVDPALATERRWAPWKPWAAVAGGVVLGAFGGALHWRATVNYAEFDDRVGEMCPDGCGPGTLPADVADLERTAGRQSQAAVVTLIAGGAILTAGAVLLVLNRPRHNDERAFTFIEKPFRDLSLTPVLGPDGAGVAARASF